MELSKKRILWFTITPSLYQPNGTSNKGGGWIESLESEVRKVDNIELAVSFHYEGCGFKEKNNNVTYYPISRKRNVLKKMFLKFSFRKRNQEELSSYLKVIHDFKPDLIQVFGTEKSFGLVGNKIQIPVVLHLQGILNPYLNAWFPPSYSVWDIIFNRLFYRNMRRLRDYYSFSKNALREKDIFSFIHYYMGRTEWDKSVTRILSPTSKYFHVNEILRDEFYQANKWENKKKEKLIFTTTISSPIYKGIDLILKTANILVESKSLEFEWNIYGNLDLTFAEINTGVKSRDVNVFSRGVVSANILVQKLQESDLFIHPSYIDNSPNSVCEAQLLGIPVISTNVGGISSIIENGINGLLVPSNDPYSMASRIMDLVKDDEFRLKLGEKARQDAQVRHNRKTILNDLLKVYSSILNDE